MKINYVPGLALRFYPGLSREAYDAVDSYIASNCKIAIFTGTAPTESELWNLSNFNAYVTANTAKLVYQETTQLQFTYDGFKHKRVIQRYPVDSTAISPLIAPIAQDAAAVTAGAIETANSLYALVYCPDKDTTLNTTGNDLVLMIPGVGSSPTDFCSLSKTNFAAGESMYLRNLTVSLFQGYQITDTLINGQYEDPLNPGQMITGPVDSKKSVYINKVWGNRISEAYRDCFVSRDTNVKVRNSSNLTTNLPVVYPSAYICDSRIGATSVSANGYGYILRKYDATTSAWLNANHGSEYDKTIYYGYLVNESMINLLDEINSKGLIGQLSTATNLLKSTSTSFTATQRFDFADYGSYAGATNLDTTINARDLIPGTLAKATLMAHASTGIKTSLKQLLVELGFDAGLIDSALKSIIPIGFDNTKYNSSYDKDGNVLTIQNTTPAKLKTRYKKTIHNPTNEQLYIVIPRFMSRAAIESTGVFTDSAPTFFTSLSSVSYPATQKVINGEVVDNSTQRIRQQDYTAISVGVTGNGETDLEYDNLDIIDYIDSFTAMLKIPNKF